MHTECGIFGIISQEKDKNVTNKVIKGLGLLQHRGRESAGIAYYNNDNLVVYKKNGLVNDVFENLNENILTDKCIGHIRYSTSGEKTNNPDFLQPYISKTK